MCTAWLKDEASIYTEVFRLRHMFGFILPIASFANVITSWTRSQILLKKNTCLDSRGNKQNFLSTFLLIILFSLTHIHILMQTALFPLVYHAVTSKTISLLLHLLSAMSGCPSMLVLMDARPGVENQMIKAIKTNIYRSILERYGAAG